MPPVVPTLPVLVPLTTAAVAGVLWWLHRSGRLTGPRAVLAVLACVYGAGVIGHVLLPLPIATDDPRPWRVWLHLVPLVDAVQDPIGIVLNTALFVPLGMLVPLATGRWGVRRVAAAGLLVSLGIEAVQLLADLTISPGRVADVDDLVGNTLGAVIGYLLLRVATTVPVLARWAGRAAWTAALPWAGLSRR